MNATGHDPYVLRRLRDRLTDLKLHSIIDGRPITDEEQADILNMSFRCPLNGSSQWLKEITRFDDVANSNQANAEKNGILGRPPPT